MNPVAHELVAYRAASLLLLIGCASDPIPPDEPVIDRVRAAVASDCAPESLARLELAAPADVRAALVRVDAELKERVWTPGLSHGHPIEAELRVPLVAGLAYDYDLYVPESYTGDPDRPLPVYVNPAHPLDDLRSETELPFLAGLLGEPALLVTVNFTNRLFSDLSETQYDAAFDDQAEAFHDMFAVFDAVLSDLRRRYVVDSSRITIGGVSAVGASAWFSGIFSADQYAAINPYSVIPAPFDEALYRNLEHVGILVVHGTADTITPVEAVRPTVERIRSWGFDLTYWEQEGEGHGTMFSATLPAAWEWMSTRERPLTPGTVTKAIVSERAAEAYWLRATELAAELPSGAALYPTAAPAEVIARWGEGTLDVESRGVARLEARWLEGPGGPAVGRAGDVLRVTVNGVAVDPITLAEDPTVAVEDYCRRSDVARAWAGRFSISVGGA